MAEAHPNRQVEVHNFVTQLANGQVLIEVVNNHRELFDQIDVFLDHVFETLEVGSAVVDLVHIP
jgi:hypothetical protein